MPVHIHVTLGNAKTNQVTNDLTSKEDNPVYQSTEETTENEKTVDTQVAMRRSMVKSAVIGSGKQILNTATNNVGKWVGNARLQQKINNAMEVVGLGMTFAQTTAIAGPVVGAIVVGTQTITNLVQTANDTAYEIRWSNRESKRSLQRAGYSNQNEMLGYRR